MTIKLKNNIKNKLINTKNNDTILIIKDTVHKHASFIVLTATKRQQKSSTKNSFRRSTAVIIERRLHKNRVQQ